MDSTSHREETLRLQFGTAATAIGTQLYAIENLNDGNRGLHRSDGRPRVLAFEAKGRIQRNVSMTRAVERGQDGVQPQGDSWSGGVQVYDHSSSPNSLLSPSSWNWDHFSERNLVEINEFRPYMPLHNVFEGSSAARDGSITVQTLDAIEDRLRGVLEECDNLRFVQNLVDMDSAWAGLSLEVLTYLSEECPGAVVATFGNDWAYPLPDQANFNVYSATGETRDKSKIAARRRINLIASVASFVEASSVFIPVALAASSRRYVIAPGGDELRGAASFAATAIEIAMSAFRADGATVFNLLEGIVPSMKIVELAARVPLVENPVQLVQEGSGHSAVEQSRWSDCSLLARSIVQRPQWHQSPSQMVPARFRRVHFRGEFESYASALYASVEGFQSSDCVTQWTRDQVYVEDASGAIAAMDGASQLALSSRVGGYLLAMATRISSQSDHRVLYEFTQAGMNADALEEFQASLRGWGDAYPRVVEADDDQSEEDE